MSKQIKKLDFQLECLRTTKNMPFYKAKLRNRPIETIDGYDKRSMMDRFLEISRSSDRGWRAQIHRAMCVIKTLNFRPLDRDRTVWMRSARSHHDRYNALSFSTCFDDLPVIQRPRDRRLSFDRSFNPAVLIAPRR